MSVDQTITEESYSTKVASYVDYVELWTQLINSNKLKVFNIYLFSHLFIYPIYAHLLFVCPFGPPI